jgi:hypothetical protein
VEVGRDGRLMSFLQRCLALGLAVAVSAEGAAGQTAGSSPADRSPGPSPACTPIVEYLLPDPPNTQGRTGSLAHQILIAGCSEALSSLTGSERTRLQRAFAEQVKDGAVVLPEARPDRASRARVAEAVNEAVGRSVVSDWVVVTRRAIR